MSADRLDAGVRCGMLALVGRANVGKSTLLNGLLGEKVSIVSPVVQTTRHVIRGVLTEERGQLVFLDTPGVHRACGELGRIMNRQARSSVEGTDAVVLVLDRSQAPEQEDEGWMRRLLYSPASVVAVLNKVDVPANHAEAYRRLWEDVCEEKGQRREVTWVEVSAEQGAGLDGLLALLFGVMPLGPLLFPADVLTDFPRRLAIADVIREALFAVLHQELPHAVGVVVDELEDRPDGLQVRALIHVQRPTQKAIVLGRKGRLLRGVKRQSEKALAALYEVPASVDLWVQVTPKWDKNFWLLKRMGH